MTKKIAFIGAGNMGQAMIKGLIASGLYPAENIVVYDAYQPLLTGLVTELKITAAPSPAAAVSQVETVIFAVKPYVLPELLTSLKDQLTNQQLLISVAAGVPLAVIEEKIGADRRIVRVMPNTPALVGAGMSAVAKNATASQEDQEAVLQIFRSFGKAEAVGEQLIDAVIGVSGSAPAYVYLFIEALADGGVLEGLSRPQAYEFAAQTVLGAAKMVLETGEHPGALKDNVSSPGGTTIAAIKVLEDHGFRAAVINAVQAAAAKNREMSK